MEALEARRLLSSSILQDINPGSSDSFPSAFVRVGQSVFFIAQGADGNFGVYQTDGTPSGTHLVAKPANVVPGSLEQQAGTSSLFFFATETGDSTSGFQDTLYRSDGTAAGTFAVDQDARFNLDWSNFGQLAPLANGTVLFNSSQSDPSAYLSETDGTVAGTSVVAAQPDGAVQELVSGDGANHAFFFASHFANNETEDGVWVTDGTAAGTQMLVSLPAPSSGDGIQQIIAAGSMAYFVDDDPTLGLTLWRSDGTPGGTFQISPSDGSWFPDYTHAAVVGSTLYFGAIDGDSEQVYQSDGTVAGTEAVPGFEAESGSLGAMTAFEGGLLFEAADSQAQLWTYLPGMTAAAPVAMINTNPANFVVAGSDAYFINFDPSEGSYELWSTDGTATGTGSVSDDQVQSFAQIDGTALGDRLIYQATGDDGDGFEPHYLPLTNISSVTLQPDGSAAQIDVQFSNPINPATLTSSDLDLARIGGGQIPDGSLSVSTTMDGTSATVQYTANSHGILPDGNYTLSLDGGDGVTDAGGGRVDPDSSGSFFILQADANHDRTVNTSDFDILASNFGKTGMHFSQGDFTYDGTVNALDFNTLATHYGTYLAPPVQNTAPAAAQSMANVFAQSPQIDPNMDDSILIGNEPASVIQ